MQKSPLIRGKIEGFSSGFPKILMNVPLPPFFFATGIPSGKGDYQ
jgi:hypothetical protein